jgi:hypothetical protein
MPRSENSEKPPNMPDDVWAEFLESLDEDIKAWDKAIRDHVAALPESEKKDK